MLPRIGSSRGSGFSSRAGSGSRAGNRRLESAASGPYKDSGLASVPPAAPYTAPMPEDPLDDPTMVEIELGRVVLRQSSINSPQYIYLREVGGPRSFPIVIGFPEAAEIQRILTGVRTERPLTHQLLHDVMEALGARLACVDVVDIRHNTFFARLILVDDLGETIAVVDSRPSDSIALALRAGCPLRVSEAVLEQVRTDQGTDPVDEGSEPRGPEEGEEESEDETPGF